MFLQVLLLLLALSIAAFFAGLETGIITFKSTFTPDRYPELAPLYEELSRVIVIILVMTNIAMISFSSLAGYLFWKIGFEDPALASSVILSPVSFILGEVLPKTLFRRHSKRLIPLLKGFLKILARVSMAVPPLFERKTVPKVSFSAEQMKFFLEKIQRLEHINRDQALKLWSLIKLGSVDECGGPLGSVSFPVEDVVAGKLPPGVRIPYIRLSVRKWLSVRGELGKDNKEVLKILEERALRSSFVNLGYVDFLVFAGREPVGIYSFLKGFLELDDVIIKWEEGMDLWTMVEFFENTDISLALVRVNSCLRVVSKEYLEFLFLSDLRKMLEG